MLCRPVGRGQWSITTFAVEGPRVSPLPVKVGYRFEFGGILWRVVRLEA